jgi:threonine aldolase
MSKAKVGDDVFDEDPTIHELQDRVASMFKMEKSLFLPTGTMSNLIAVMTWCNRRDAEVILGDLCHIHIYEQGGVSQFGGISTHLVPTNSDGSLDIRLVESSIRQDNIHYPVTQLVAVENTHNYRGGKALTPSYMDKLGEMTKRHKLPLHVDGARIWNAATALNCPPKDLVRSVDSVSVCLSKGLGAPAGTLLVGNREFIKSATRARKALGGGMRQSGVLAAAGLQALDDFEGGMLKFDHSRAKRLAETLCKVPGLKVNPTDVQTNIIVVELGIPNCDAAKFIAKAREDGVLILPRGSNAVRLVTHRDLSDELVDLAIERLTKTATELLKKSIA